MWQVRLLRLGGLNRGDLQVTPKGCGGIPRISVGLADGVRGAQWEHQDRELRAGDGQRGLQ